MFTDVLFSYMNFKIHAARIKLNEYECFDISLSTRFTKTFGHHLLCRFL